MNNHSDLLHSFKPIYNRDSRILILGTMASPASLRAGMYYGHPQNAFWRILTELTGEEPARTNEEKKAFLLRNRIAVWDTLESCEREGAADSAIRQQHPNDVAGLIHSCPALQAVFLNGGAAYAFYKRYHAQRISQPFFRLPSTSPANARGGYSRKLEAWRKILDYLS